jgi:hypothetical protein
MIVILGTFFTYPCYFIILHLVAFLIYIGTSLLPIILVGVEA